MARWILEALEDPVPTALLKLNVENGLRQALETGALEVSCQPKIQVSTGLIVPMGEYVLEQACRDFVAIPGSPSFPVSVNVSTRQIHSSGFVEMVADVLARTGLHGERLELEITESIFLSEASWAKEALWRVKELGVRLALDDFGTGYSAMRCLKSFPIDRIKVDREFVRDIHLNEENQAIVAAIIAMSCRLGIEVTAEGVEAAEEEAVLKANGCDELQGFLYSKLLPRSEFDALLKRSDVD